MSSLSNGGEVDRTVAVCSIGWGGSALAVVVCSAIVGSALCGDNCSIAVESTVTGLSLVIFSAVNGSIGDSVASAYSTLVLLVELLAN